MTLLSQEAALAASAEAALKQASSASEAAQKLMSDKKKPEAENKENEEVLAQLKKELAASKKGTFIYIYVRNITFLIFSTCDIYHAQFKKNFRS